MTSPTDPSEPPSEPPSERLPDPTAEPAPEAALQPYQVCFVVDDVAAAAEEAQARFGWGPFRSFRNTAENIDYRGRSVRREADVALAMAGDVQVELLHVHDGVDCLAAYQASFGRGLQHIGIATPSREAALARLERLGACVDHRDEFAGIRLAFVDLPTGPGMFELVDRTSGSPTGASAALPEPGDRACICVDRATVVTERMDEALGFFGASFGWQGVTAEPATLREGDQETRLRRAIGRAGRLEIELVEGRRGERDPYSRHLARGGHGLVHASARTAGTQDGSVAATAPAAPGCAWLESGERFTLVDWAGGIGSLQLRTD